MPTKRRAAKCRTHRITREALDAFRAGDKLTLHRAIELRPWQPRPLETDMPEPPDNMLSGPRVEAWPLALDLRGKFERAN